MKWAATLPAAAEGMVEVRPVSPRAWLVSHAAVANWPPLHTATAELPRQQSGSAKALAGYRRALELGVPEAQRILIDSRIRELEG